MLTNQPRMLLAAAAVYFGTSAIATPTPVISEAATQAGIERRAASNAITNETQLQAAIASFKSLDNVTAADAAGLAIFSQIVPQAGPTSIAGLLKDLQIITSANPGDLLTSGYEILLNGLSGGDYADIIMGFTVESNTDNNNTVPPKQMIYPKADPSDAPYSLNESDLRKVIYIPPDFTYGRLPPVVFLPGTAALAGQNFAPNIAKLLKQQKVADPVFVNIPGENLADIQVAAEYAAYAVNYIASISSRNVSTVSWSAGSLDGQWALKYWPSTRKVLSNKFGISPDYHGTVFAKLICPGFPTPGSTPAICQQNYNATFIATLRNNGGDSAYVPTTNIYSIFDEIVEPQSDPNASGALNDARGVGVTNVELQSVCTAVLPGGTFYNSHEGVLYNALAYALIVDGITHGGPGSLARVNTTYQCSQFAAPGLSLADIFATEALVPIALAAGLAFQPKVAMEPPIMPYAQKDVPA